MTDDELRDQVLKGVADRPSPARATVQAVNLALLAGGIAIAVAVFLYEGGFRELFQGAPADGPARDPLLIVVTTLGSVAIAGTAWWVGHARGRSMTGPSRSRLLAVVVAAPVLFFLWKVGWSILFGADTWWAQRVGARCFDLSFAMGTSIFVALLLTQRESDPVHPRVRGAALGVAAGAMTATLLDLWCPVGHPLHVLFGHVLPMLIFAVLGAGPASRVLGTLEGARHPD